MKIQLRPLGSADFFSSGSALSKICQTTIFRSKVFAGFDKLTT